MNALEARLASEDAILDAPTWRSTRKLLRRARRRILTRTRIGLFHANVGTGSAPVVAMEAAANVLRDEGYDVRENYLDGSLDVIWRRAL